jgi:MFS family permease
VSSISIFTHPLLGYNNARVNEEKSLASLFRALRHRNYRLFFIGQGLSLIGTWIQQTGEVWLAYRLTHSAMALGVVGFASQIPTFILASFAGAWIDRTNKHRLVTIAQILAMGQAFALAGLVLTGHITYHRLILLALLSGAIDALEIPSRQSFVIEMVDDPADLANSIALNSSLVNLARLVGPAVAGLLIAAVGEGWCFFINGASYFAIIIGLLSMNLRSVDRITSRSDLWQSFKEGFSYASGSVPIVTLLGSLAVVSFFGASYTVLIPIFAAQVLHGGAHTLGFLMAASGMGALAGALYLASRRNVIGLGRIIGRGIALFGLGLIAFSFSHWFWASWAMMLTAGFGMMTATASVNTMLQTIVEPDKRGRVMSFFTTAFIGMAPLGNFAGGALASRIGAPHSVGIAGLLCLAAALAYARNLPTLRKHVRPIYTQLGILPAAGQVVPEVATGLQAASTTLKPRG